MKMTIESVKRNDPPQEAFSRPLHGLQTLRSHLIPPVNCWATVIRPLRGLYLSTHNVSLLFSLPSFRKNNQALR